MSDVVKIGKSLYRISPDDSKVIEFSTNGGQNWIPQKQKGKTLEFTALESKGRSLIAATTDGKRYSDNGGKKWYGTGLRILKALFSVIKNAYDRTEKYE